MNALTYRSIIRYDSGNINVDFIIEIILFSTNYAIITSIDLRLEVDSTVRSIFRESKRSARNEQNHSQLRELHPVIRSTANLLS